MGKEAVVTKSTIFLGIKKVKGKAVPLEAWIGPVKIPRFHYNGTGWW